MGWPEKVANLHGTEKRTYGEAVTYHADGQADQPVLGIFRDAHAELTLTGESEVSSRQPTLGVRLDDLATEPRPYQTHRVGLPTGDRVTIRGVLYEVHDEHPDGMGWTELLLHLAPV